MKLWVINPYGNIPGEGWKLHRSFMISDAFAKRGHDVTYWVSNVDHRSKRIRSEHYSELIHSKNLLIKIIPTQKYTEHISLDRIKSEVLFIKNLRDKALRDGIRPDYIIVGEPALFISKTVINLSNRLNAKLIVDFIDIWPELFRIALPKFLAPFYRIILAPLFWKRRWFVQKASALISVSEAYMKIAKTYNPYAPSKVIYWGVDISSFNLPEKNNILSQLNIPFKIEGELWLIYAGTLGDNYDLKTILQLANHIENSNFRIRLLIAGDGNLRSFVQNSISKMKSGKTIFLGRIPSEDLNALYKYCDVSLSTYVPGSTVSMPIKAFDYFAAGLPMINSLGMDLQYFVETREVGLQYKAGDAKNMLEKILTFYNNPNLLLKMKLNCKNLGKDFDQAELYQGYVNFVENLNS